MHMLTDHEMQRFVRGTGVVGALLLVAGILGLGLWAVSLGGLLLVLAGLVILAAVEDRELDETPAAAIRQPVAAGRTTSAPDAEGPRDDRGPSSLPGDRAIADDGASASTGARTDVEGSSPSSGPAVVDVPPTEPAKATLSPLERLAMALPPGALPDRRPAPSRMQASSPVSDPEPPLSPADVSPPDPVPDPPPAAAPPLVVDLRDDASDSSARPSTSSAAVELPSPGSTDEPGPEPAVVTFRLPRSVGAQAATVVGEFNDWSPDANPMAPEDDAFVARIPLEPGRAYRYRYLLDGVRWENDWAADGYVPNEYGGDDSLIDLRRS